MKFSIIVPIYNIENFLGKCIESILQQTYSDFELILVDDGSTDSSTEICDNYAEQDSRIVVIHKKNGGLVSARQAGIEIAKGEYTLYVDGDDWISSDTLQKINIVLAKEKFDIICFGFIEVTMKGNFKTKVNADFGIYDKARIESEIFSYLIENEKSEYFSHNACGKIFHTELLTNFQKLVNPEIVMSEDAAVTIPCICKAKSMYIMEECLYYYNRLNDTSITKKKKPFSWKTPYLLQEHFLSFDFLNTPYFRPQIYRNVVHNLFNVAVSQFNSGKSYSYNKKVIESNISSDNYEKALKFCDFSIFSKGKLAELALRYRLYVLIWLYWKMKP